MKRTLVSCCALAGLLLLGPGVVMTDAQGPVKQIIAQPSISWSPNTLELKEGEVVEWVIQKNQLAEHGVVIKNWAEVRKFFDIEFVPQPPKFPAPDAGTSKNAILRLRVKELPDQPVPDVAFTCTVHGPASMNGTLKLKK